MLTKIYCALRSMNALWKKEKKVLHPSFSSTLEFLSDSKSGINVRLSSESKQTYHFLHVRRHGLDSTAQSIVLCNNLKTLLHPKS